jgi:putative hemolysin
MARAQFDVTSLAATGGAGGLAGAARLLEVSWAASEADVTAAQRLRYQIFSEEMGARIDGPVAGIDSDRFDAYCDHLLVRRADDGLLLGTYRVLAPDGARRAGGFYTDQEFDLSPLQHLRPRAVELGRSCVHAEWRTGGVILALWSALGSYMLRHQLDTMIGCASIGLQDGGARAKRVWQQVAPALAEPVYRVSPRAPLPLTGPHEPAAGRRGADIPPLIKGYLRCGAKVLGPPALDRVFNTADLPIMLRLDDLAPRYRNHLLGQH